jgi:hypothetical protein
VGRPKRRRNEEVERELKGMGVKDWKRLALERDKWKKIVEAKERNTLYSRNHGQYPTNAGVGLVQGLS